MAIVTESAFKEFIRTTFEHTGFSVTSIPESPTEKTADLHIADGSCSALLELKIKGDSDELVRKRDEILDSGEVFLHSESSLRRNTLSGLISQGVDQLVETANYDHDYKILWLHSAGLNAEHNDNRFHATLYGARDIIHIEDNIDETRVCYYFDYSDFYRYRDVLDAAVLSSNEEAKFCINDLSPRADDLRNSSIRQIFRGGYCDPFEFEKEGIAYRLTTDFDRSVKGSALQEIRKKYKCGRVLDLDMQSHTAEKLVEKNPNNGGSANPLPPLAPEDR
jgi:hypothetical protein